MKNLYRIVFVGLSTLALTSSSWAFGLKKHETTWDIPIVDNGYKICVIGDTGMGNENQAKVARALEQEGCDQIRIVGDVIYPKGLRSKNDPQFLSKFYQPYKAVIDSPQAPKFFIALGNHDYDGNEKVWVKLDREHDFVVAPHRYYAENYPTSGVCIATLDTSPFDSFKHFLKVFGHGSWLRRRIRDFQKNCEFSIAFAHHPYLNSGHHGDAKAFLKLFLKRNVIGHFDLYFAGHEHLIADEGKKNGTSLYISGGGGGDLHDEPTHTPPGGFVAAQQGYLTVVLNRNAEQKIVATTRFRVVTDQGSVTKHEKTVVGKGMR